MTIGEAPNTPKMLIFCESSPRAETFYPHFLSCVTWGKLLNFSVLGLVYHEIRELCQMVAGTPPTVTLSSPPCWPVLWPVPG